jgi:predicted MPP superfamily phosphohydrolase
LTNNKSTTDSAHPETAGRDSGNRQRPHRRSVRSIQFLAIISVIIWLVVSAPLLTLLSWLLDQPLKPFLIASVVVTPLVALWMWTSVQSATSPTKWPAMQLLGAGTILLSVVTFCAPLLWFADKSLVGIVALVVWLTLIAYGAHSATSVKTTALGFTSKSLKHKHKFVQISDVHIGSRSKAFMQRIVDKCNHHQPDGVFITGDLLDSSSVNSNDLRPLADLQCPAWMCLGNHERYVDLEAAIHAVEDNGVEILRNRVVPFKELCIIGIDDADDNRQVSRHLPRLNVPADTYSILLYHRPAGWDDALAHNVDLMLSGHTHGGQIWPFGLLVKLQFRRMLGLFSESDKHLYVSAGTGTWGPTLRLGTRSEMTIIEIGPAQ